MATATKKTHDFTITLAGVPVPPDELTDAEWHARMADVMDELCGRILANGCDDSFPHSTGSTFFLSFGREAESLADAIGSAIRDVERAGFSVVKIEVGEET